MAHENDHDLHDAPKRQHTQRACNTCRRRKKRCDGPEMTDRRCSYCLASNIACTYDEVARVSQPTDVYVQALEQRVAAMEGLLQHINPGTLSGIPLRPSSSLLSESLPPTMMPSPLTLSSHSPVDSDREPAEDDTHRLAQWLEQLKLDPATPRFHGENSSRSIMMSAMHFKQQRGSPLHAPDAGGDTFIKRRKEYWQAQPWESEGLDTFGHCGSCGRHQSFDFPPDDLLPILIHKYFSELGKLMLLVYRPGFEKSVREGLHLRDDGFAHLLLMICALGSPFVDDPRVLIDGSPLSSGWKYLHQVPLVRKSLLTPPTLYEMQICCLACKFLAASSIPQAYWQLLGTGIRMALDLGIHRKQVYSNKPNVQEEQWKRCFWMLITFDLQISISMGRPSAIHSEDVDIDMPLEVDDEYWEPDDPNQAFVQPPGKPSYASIFVWYIKLCTVLGYATRTIYSIKKSKMLQDFVGAESEWEQKVVSHLDSSLNEWVDSLPDHLRWDPNREDQVFFCQSAAIWSAYYQVQMNVHRPFVSQTDKQGARAFPSLAICLNAARACIRVAHCHLRRRGGPVPTHIYGCFSSAVLLLFNIWSGGREGLSLDPVKEMAAVHHAMEVMKACESRWPLSGRVWDILSSLASTSNSHLPVSRPMPASKRKSPGDIQSSLDSTYAEPLHAAEATQNTLEPINGSLDGGRGNTDLVKEVADWPVDSLPTYELSESYRWDLGASGTEGPNPAGPAWAPALDCTLPTDDVAFDFSSDFSPDPMFSFPADSQMGTDWDTFFKSVARESLPRWRMP